MSNGENNFFISFDKKSKALAALQKIEKEAGTMVWTNSRDLQNSDSLERALERLRYPVETEFFY